MIPTGAQVAAWVEERPAGLPRGTSITVSSMRDLGDTVMDEAAIAALYPDGAEASRHARQSLIRTLVRHWQANHTTDGTRLVAHRIRLRPSVDIEILLPEDLTGEESRRIGQWIAMLGVDPARPAPVRRIGPAGG